MSKTARLAVDIGGTFTDLVLALLPDRSLSTAVLTTHDAPERAVLEGTAAILAQAGITAADLALVIHGTTLATNALIERKGAKTALVTTEGFRDLEIAYEHRFEQYDLYMERPESRRCRAPCASRSRNASPPTARCCWRWTKPPSIASARRRATGVEALAVCFPACLPERRA